MSGLPPHPPAPPRERERVGNYLLGSEVGRGSFAHVVRAYRATSRELVAIKVVQRSKMTSKLLENLEAEIAILKAIDHPNIVGLEDCLKEDERIYLIMDYCSGGDLSVYIKKRGRIPTLDYVPRGSELSAGGSGKTQYWPHPDEGGLDEVVVRCFLGQLALAIQFLRTQNLIHRDIKPQNLLLQPASAAQIAAGHPVGIPILKVADFGFARFLDGASMAETLCGSPLYMAPEILRYEKYDAKADLWSVGTVLYEMSVGRPPFKAQNHVELLKKIERGEDRIRFPDERSGWAAATAETTGVKPVQVSKGVKEVIRRLLKRNPVQRIGFEEFFRDDVVGSEMAKLGVQPAVVPLPPLPASMQATSSTPPSGAGFASRISASSTSSRSSAIASAAVPPQLPHAPRNTTTTTTSRTSSDAVVLSIPVPTRPAPPPPPFALPLPVSPAPPVLHSSPTQHGLHPHRASSDASAASTARQSSYTPSQQADISRHPPPIMINTGPSVERRPSFEPRYLVGPGDDTLSPSLASPSPREIPSSRRESRSRDRPTFIRDPSSTNSRGGARESITFGDEDDDTGKDYVVLNTKTVEIDLLADEIDAASRGTVSRRQSSRSIVSRPLSAFSTTSGTPPSQGGGDNSSPPPTSFALSVTPPFAIPASPSSRPPLLQQHSLALTRPLSVPQSPVAPYAANQSTQQSGSHSSGHNFLPRYSSSPSVVGGVLARAFSAVSLFGRSPTNVSSGLGGATRISSTRRKTALLRTGSAGEPLSDPAEEALVVQLEELAQKAFVVFELADQKLAPLLPGYNAGSVLGTSYNSPCSSGGFAQLYAGSSPQQQQQPHSIQAHRKSSSSNSNSGSDNSLLRADVICPEALLLYVAASTFLNKGIEAVSAFWRSKRSRESGAEVGIELNEAMQWFRARFNHCYDMAEWCQPRAPEDLGEPSFVDRILYEKAMELSRSAAVHEALGADPAAIVQAYETAIWLFKTMLDDTIREGRSMEDADRTTVEKFITAAQKRLDTIRKRMAAQAAATSPVASSPPTPMPTM